MNELNINLDPSEAVMPMTAREPLDFRAIESEKTKGTEQTSFRIPTRLKTLVNALSHELPGMEGQATRIYLLAIAQYCANMAAVYDEDDERTEVVRELQALTRFLQREDLVARFMETLRDVEKRVAGIIELHDVGRAFNMLDVMITTIEDCGNPVAKPMRAAVQTSEHMKKLLTLVMDSRIGMTDKANSMQMWFITQ